MQALVPGRQPQVEGLALARREETKVAQLLSAPSDNQFNMVVSFVSLWDIPCHFTVNVFFTQ